MTTLEIVDDVKGRSRDAIASESLFTKRKKRASDESEAFICLPNK